VCCRRTGQDREAIPENAPDSVDRAFTSLAKGAVEGDLGEGALENAEILVVQLR